jgi:hypothetical protein
VSTIVEEDRLVPMRRLFLLVPLVLAAVLLPGSGRAADPIVLKGIVGPGFTITLRDASNQVVSRVLPGDYAIQVDDRSIDHNFHLSGPGVDMRSAVETTGLQTWNVTLVDGKYTFKCDAHPSIMRGVLNVGVAPPPTPKLNGRVGPGKAISLKTASGAMVKRLKAGAYKVSVKDVTKLDNFHLLGPGVNKKTGVKFRGAVVWKVRFQAGKKYTVRSDAHLKLRRAFTATAP